jgi:chromosome condensin MukBEF complex kleisin-like MukF subunit
LEKQTAKKQKKPLMRLFSIGRWYMIDQAIRLGVSEICYTLFRGKLTTCFAGKEMQHMR